MIKLEFDKNSLMKARAEALMTMEEAARILQIDIAAYWRMEKSKSRVRAEDLPKLMDLFNKPLSFFFKNKNEDEKLKVTLNVGKKKESIQNLLDYLTENPESLFNSGDMDMLEIELKNF